MPILKRFPIVAAMLLFLLSPIAARADSPSELSQPEVAQRGPFFPKVKIEVVLQEVEVDGVRFGFEAHVAFCANHQPVEGGFVEFTSRDGEALRLVPVWGTVDRKTGGVVLTFTPVVDREIEPNDLVVAVVQPSTTDPGCVIWDYVGDSTGNNTLPPPFDAEGTISLSRGGGECAPVDYGQLDAFVLIDTPLQEVEPLPPSNIVGFEARMGLNRNQAAGDPINTDSFFDIYYDITLRDYSGTSTSTVSYEPIYGAAFPGDDAIIYRVAVILLLADRQAPLNTNDHLLRATVTVERANPDCQFWDLTNGESGAVDGKFEAMGSIRVRLP